MNLFSFVDISQETGFVPCKILQIGLKRFKRTRLSVKTRPMKKLLPMLVLISFPLFAHGPQMALIEEVDEVDAIIDGDTRTQVLDHKDPVTNAVGLLAYGNGFCTATLITPRHVLTNGHCVASGKAPPFKLNYAGGYKFYPGKLSAKDPGIGEYRSIRIDTFGQWVSTGNPDFDMAVIKLDRPVAGVTPVRIQRNNQVGGFADFLLSIHAYSSKTPYGTQWYGSGVSLGAANSNSFYHTIDTLPGTSGAMIKKRFGNMWVGVGIHRGSEATSKETKNRGVYFNNMIFGKIQNWVKN